MAEFGRADSGAPIGADEWPLHKGDKPDGVFPLYMQPDTLKEYGAPKIDDEVSFTWVDKAKMQQECQDKGAMCDWDPQKGEVAKHCKGDRFLLVFDEEEVWGENFYICSDAYAEVVMAKITELRPAVVEAAAEEGGEAEAWVDGPIMKDEWTLHTGDKPDGVFPLYMQPDTLKEYGVPKIDDEVSIVWVDKAKMQQECQDKGAMCDWDPQKGNVADHCKGEQFLMVFDEDEVWGENFYICSDAFAPKVLEAQEAILAAKRPAPGAAGGSGEEGEEGEEGEDDGEPKKPAIPEVPLPPLVIAHPTNEDGSAPKDVLPMFLTPDCRAKFGIEMAMLPSGKPDEKGSAFKFIDKETAYKDIQTNAKLSDWYECKDFIDNVKDIEGEVPGFNVIYDGEEIFGESFYLCGPDHFAKYLANVEAAKVLQQQQWKEAKAALMLELGLSESSEEEDPNAPEPEIADIQPSEEGWTPVELWKVPPGEENTGEVLRLDQMPEEIEGEGAGPVPESYIKLPMSDSEVVKLTVKDERPMIQMNLKRKRRYFGGTFFFQDTDAADIEGVEIRKMTMEDPNFKLKRSLNDKQVQAVPNVVENTAQTTFFVKRNAVMQYEPITMSEEERDENIFSDEMREFLTITRDRYELSLQQNEVVNLFQDPYKEGDDDGLDYAEKTDEDITPQQNFPERNRSVMFIDFQPGKKGVVGVCSREQGDLDRRVETAGGVGGTNSKILVYDITEAMAVEPIFTLIAPDDIHAFRFNPTNPNMVVGGTKTGQVCMWDLSLVDGPKAEKPKDAKKKKGAVSAVVAPPLVWSLYSHIEESHEKAVSDVQWLTQGYRYIASKKGGTYEETTDAVQYQFVSAAADGLLIIWDCSQINDPNVRELASKDPLRYDAHWAPIWKTNLRSLEGMPMAIERFRMMGEGLKWVCSSQEGEVATGDAFPLNTAAQTTSQRQQGAVMVVQESPYMKGIFLTVGDWTFNIYKEGVAEPLFTSPYSPRYLKTGAWSPTRPGLIMIARDDGLLQAWDLLGRNSASEPTDQVSINNLALTTLSFAPTAGSKSNTPAILAVGDEAGTLHILELPRNLWRQVPNEKALVEGMLEREVSRVNYVKSRLEIREDELQKKEAAAAKAAADQAAQQAKAPAPGPGADEDAEDDPEAARHAAEAAAREAELVALEAAYVEAEAAFRVTLGLDNGEDGEGGED